MSKTQKHLSRLNGSSNRYMLISSTSLLFPKYAFFFFTLKSVVRGVCDPKKCVGRKDDTREIFLKTDYQFIDFSEVRNRNPARKLNIHGMK